MLTLFSKTFTKLTEMPLGRHIGLAALAFAGFQGARLTLDASYAASRYPVDYFTGQLSFSAEKLMGYYDVMQEAGTLGLYLRTQLIDFAFIAGVMAVGLTLGALIGRLGPKGGWTRKLALAVSALSVLGGCFDIAENLLSFGLIAHPDDMPNVLALAQSSMAALKFACLVPAVCLMPVALALGLASRLRGAVPVLM